jgi:hypothetical protein
MISGDDDDLSDVEEFDDEDDVEELDQCSHGVSFDDECELCDEEWEDSDDEGDDDTDDEGEDDDALYAR